MKKFLVFAFVFLISLPAFAQNAPVGYGSPSTSLSASSVLKTAAGSLYDMQVNTTVSGWVMLFDAAALPGNGAVTPIKWYQVQANATLGINFDAAPLLFVNGLVAACSTTGPFTLTASATCTFSGEVK